MLYYIGLFVWGSSTSYAGYFNKYQILDIVISICIYQFIVQSYHNVIISIYSVNVKRMLPFYRLCLPKNL
jgi:hypothetical protein